jgi:hypothetical protein
MFGYPVPTLSSPQFTNRNVVPGLPRHARSAGRESVPARVFERSRLATRKEGKAALFDARMNSAASITIDCR